MRFVLALLMPVLLATPLAAQSVVEERDKAEAEALTASERAAAATIARARLEQEQALYAEQLAALGPKIQAREQALFDAQERLDALETEVADANTRLLSTIRRLEKLLAAVQRAAREPTPSLLANPDRPVDAARSAILMRSLSKRLQQETATAREDLDVIAKAKSEAAKVTAAAQIELDAFRSDEDAARSLLLERKDALAAAEAGAAAAQARADALKDKADTLEAFVSSLERASLYRPRRRPPPQVDSVYRLPDGATRLPRAKLPPFATARGSILRPVAGRIIDPETTRYPSRRADPGLYFLTRPHAQVIAPWNGVVKYAGVFPSYGMIVILEPQRDWQIVITGLATVNRGVGDRVLAGEPLGRMGGPAPTSDEFVFELSEETRSLRERLYLEIRRQGKPVNPRPWIDDGTKKVSGL
ncbi:MAG: peptidoglycan DD-metalloendopeptidase family protein [Pseudomonadota bacterium]